MGLSAAQQVREGAFWARRCVALDMPDAVFNAFALITSQAAEFAAANPPALRPPSPTAVLEDLEDVHDLQEEKALHRKHTVGHSEAESAVKEMEEIERLGEEEKLKKSRR